MHKDLVVKSRTLTGTSDLTLLAPIKPGLVPSLEAVTYRTRVKRLLATLNAGRSTTHEYSMLRPFSDSVERVGKIQAVRVAIVEPDRLLLSVTFDGGLESYVRTLWHKVGCLLDVIFCNTVDYVTAADHRYDEWVDWVRRVQIETGFHYAMPGLTVDDVQYLRRDEALRRQSPVLAPAQEALEAVRQACRSAEDIAWSVSCTWNPKHIAELGRQGLRSLSVVYRLASLYLPGTPDGACLQRAARELLLEFVRLSDAGLMDDVIKEGRRRFDEPLSWLLQAPSQRAVPELPATLPVYDMDDVQGGIVRPYQGVTSGCMLLIGFDDAAAGAAFLRKIGPRLATARLIDVTPDAPAVNLALTCDGLRALGLDDDDIALFPEEFQQGMPARAALLGDLRGNHPRRWRLPLRHVAGAALPGTPGSTYAGLPTGDVVELTTVHAIVQIRTCATVVSQRGRLDAGDPLCAEIAKLLDGHAGVQVLSIQPLHRLMGDDKKPREHFGFSDGEIAEPSIEPSSPPGDRRAQIHLGELLLGHANEADPAPPRPDPTQPGAGARELRDMWLSNGSFLVVRKLRQDVPALEDAVRTFAGEASLDEDDVFARMMGRWRDGRTLMGGKPGNDFDYALDPDGRRCPLHAHVRRANPRDHAVPLPSQAGRRNPVLARRGMSYGPRHVPGDAASASEERGLVFMAYNASIAEQFETVQRWLAGGNATGGFSGQSDPFLGVPPASGRKVFRFEAPDRAAADVDRVHCIALDGVASPLDEPKPFVRLEWGLYAFTPSMRAIDAFARRAVESLATPGVPWSLAEGRNCLRRLEALERNTDRAAAALAWKTALEDGDLQDSFASAGLWSAIRADCGGVLRTPYGVLVASREKVDQVLSDPHGHYSVRGYHDRMAKSIGEIFLGLDDTGPSSEYRRQSHAANTAISAITRHEAYGAARDAAQEALAALVRREKELSVASGDRRWELNLNLREVFDATLATLCQAWFGLPAQKHAHPMQPGGMRWDWQDDQPPYYPGHFTAPSRYFFQPRPAPTVEQCGQRYGKALTLAFTTWVRTLRDESKRPSGTVAAAILDAFPRPTGGTPAALARSDALAARTVVGALMGFLPTVDGNLKLSLNEWLREGRFWSLRTQLADRSGPLSLADAESFIGPALKAAMQLRPAPELIWRTARDRHQIGDVAVRPGDRIVLALVSATHDDLEHGRHGATLAPVFGGRRAPTAGACPRTAAAAACTADTRQGTAATGAAALPPPTHACPGYEAAMGVLLGVTAAFLTCKESMRPAPASLALTLEGPVPPSASTPSPGSGAIDGTSSSSSSASSSTSTSSSAAARPPSVATSGASQRPDGVLLVEGDSWVSYHSGNLASFLAPRLGLRIAGTPVPGLKLQDVVSPPRQRAFCQQLRDRCNLGEPPVAVLLSAGGNDMVRGQLETLFVRTKSGPPGWELSDDLVRQRIDVELRGWLSGWVGAVQVAAPHVPIILHGYADPIPDRRCATGQESDDTDWLGSVLARKGIADLADRFEVMRHLIDRLNAMQRDVADAAGGPQPVICVNLTGVLSTELANAAYKTDWANELHPTPAGFARLANVLAERVKSVIGDPAAAAASATADASAD